MKVYLVTSGFLGMEADEHIGIFSSQELAQAYIDNNPCGDPSWNMDIEEFTLDVAKANE